MVDPDGRDASTLARTHSAGSTNQARNPFRPPQPGHAGCHARRLAGAARRIADRPAHRPGGRRIIKKKTVGQQAQAHHPLGPLSARFRTRSRVERGRRIRKSSASAGRIIRISFRKPLARRDCTHRMENDMTLSRTAMLVTVASLAFAGGAAPTLAQMQMKEQTVTVGGAPMYPSKNIIQNAVNSKDHTTLVAAVKAAGLVETLQGPGPFTVFAPTNAAFAKLPPGTVDSLLKPDMKAKLTGVLTYHVVPGRLSARDLMDAAKKNGGKAEFRTVEGETISVESKGNTLIILDSKGNASKVTIQNEFQSNGVIHVIDSVLLPS